MEKSKLYKKLKDGEAYRINLKDTDLKLACCDCGLVHTFQFHKIKEEIYDIAIFRDKKTTKRLRKEKYGKLQTTMLN